MAKKEESTTPAHPLDDAAKALLERATKEGKIDQKDILKDIPETPENLDILDKLYSDLAEANVDVSGAVVKPNPELFTNE
jgi:hypothetical protein